MPINADINMDPNTCGYSLPVDACVGDAGPSPTEVTVISKSAGRASGTNVRQTMAGGNPYAGGKSTTPGWKNPRTVMSGPDLPNDYDTDDPNRY